MDSNIEHINGNYFYLGRAISRKQYQKIKYGNWSSLTADQILAKLTHKSKRKAIIEGYEVIYEELLKTPQGQYYLGIAQEKVANEFIRIAKKIKNEGRRIVKKNRSKIPQQTSC